MPWRERLVPVRMCRVAVVAPRTRWRAALVAIADAGTVEPQLLPATVTGPATELRDRILRDGRPAPGADQPPAADQLPGADRSGAVLSREEPDLDALSRAGAVGLINGEAEIERVSASALEHHGVRALAGWAPADRIDEMSLRLAPLGGAVVELPTPRGVDPPTVLPAERLGSFRPLVDTYATVPYRNVDPTWFAALAYVVMFGMMFGDVGDGLLIILGALLLRFTTSPRLAALRAVWAMLAALGVSAVIFGFLYGEFFGPTGVVPVAWLAPLDEPLTLIAAAIAVGAVLLAVSYAIGIVNRWREGGPGLALYAPTGIAGATLFLSLALVTGGIVWSEPALWGAGAILALVGLALSFVGLRMAAEPGAAGIAQAVVELFDTVIRLLANVVSFARLAAFGLTHAALGLVVWDATTALWGGARSVLAILVFVVGRALSFALEALVAGVQALRLEYYELFSRIFVTEGRPFRPWHVPLATSEEGPC